MATRRVLRSVTKNFLGTYASRYTEHDGYWLFGFLAVAASVEIDLFGRSSDDSSGLTADARDQAIRAFDGVLSRCGLHRSWVASARLTITSTPSVSPPKTTLVRSEQEMMLTVIVVDDRGGAWSASRTMLVEPHDPTVERRSVRGRQDE